MSTPLNQQLQLLKFQTLITESEILELQARLKTDTIFTNKDLIPYKSFQLSHKVLQYEILTNNAQVPPSKNKKTLYDTRTINADIQRLHTSVEELQSQEETPLSLSKAQSKSFPLLLKKHQQTLSELHSEISALRYADITAYGLLLSLVILSLPVSFGYFIFHLLTVEGTGDNWKSIIITYGTSLWFFMCFGMVIWWDYLGVREIWFDESLSQFWSSIWALIVNK